MNKDINIELKQRGLNAQKKTIEGIFEFAECMVQLSINCEAKKGGSTYRQKAQEWWNIKNNADKWLRIGLDNKLRYSVPKLPASFVTLTFLQRLTDEQFQHGLDTGIINPGMKRGDVKQLKPINPNSQRKVVAVEKSSPEITEKVATGEVTQEEARMATVVTRTKKPEDIVKHHIKSVQKVMPPKFREQPRVAGSLPSFSQVAIKKAEADILTTLNKLESREDSKDVMEAYTAVMSHMDIAMKPVLADVKDAEITKRKKELDKREEDLDKREAALIKGDYVIPSLLNGKGFTGEERKKIRSCLHPDREATHDKKAEAFQIFQKVFN